MFYLLVYLHRHPLAHADPPLSEDTGDWPRQPVQVTDFLRDHSGAAPVAALVSMPCCASVECSSSLMQLQC